MIATVYSVEEMELLEGQKGWNAYFQQRVKWGAREREYACRTVRTICDDDDDTHVFTMHLSPVID